MTTNAHMSGAQGERIRGRVIRWIDAILVKMAVSFGRSSAVAATPLMPPPEGAREMIRRGREALAAGDLSAATVHYRASVLLEPDNAGNLAALAYVLTEQGLHEQAWPYLEMAARLMPADPDIHFQRGNFQMEVGELANARQCYQTALALRPGYVEVLSNLGHVLGREGSADAAIASFEKALAIDSSYLPAHSNLLWALSFQIDATGERYLREARRYGEKVLAMARPYGEWITRPGRGILPGQRLRVGLVSGDFREHPVGAFLEGVLARMDPARVELLAYSMNPRDDALTQRIKRHISRWTPIVSLDDQTAARAIHEDAVDILVDLTGHSAFGRLPVFAWRPAPVQVSWLGYLASTGVSAIDCVLLDPLLAPLEVQDQFAETVWHLPQTLFCFTPPAEDRLLAVTAPPALRNGYITFGSFQRINKVSDSALAAWGRILQAMPQAQLWLRNDAMSDGDARHRLLDRLGRAGIPASRVTLGARIAGRLEYLAAYNAVDIILDTFPHPGATTTCEALWMGVPTVTLALGSALGRIGVSLLTCAGLKDWVAWSEDEYVALAVRQASATAELARLRACLRQQVAGTPLFDAAKFAPQLETALTQIWQSKMSGTLPVAGSLARSAEPGAN